MIQIYTPYIRRNEMDSVLTYLVDSSIDPVVELQKSLKKLLNIDNLFLFRDLDHSLLILLKSMEIKKGSEILISALSPISYYHIINSLGYIPVVVDVDLDTGLLHPGDIKKKCGDNTALLINTYNYSYQKDDDFEWDIPQLNIFQSGLIMDKNDEFLLGPGHFNIISLENSALINSMGGAIVQCGNENSEYITQQVKINPTLRLQELNASFLNSQISDTNTFFTKYKHLTDIYKNSILKSGYYTFDSENSSYGNFFPVIVKKSLNEIQKYARNKGIETERAFSDSIIKNSDLKASNAKSLCSRTLLFPLSLAMKKDSIELISKILSTLP